MEPKKIFLKKSQMAERYNVCERTIDTWTSQGLLVYFKVRNVLRFDAEASDASLNGVA